MGKSKHGGKNGWVRGDNGGVPFVCVCVCVCLSVLRSVYLRYPIRIVPVAIQVLTWK